MKVLVDMNLLAASRETKPSVVQVRAEDVRPQAIGSQVVAALQKLSAQLQEGVLLTIDVARTRARVLPLKP